MAATPLRTDGGRAIEPPPPRQSNRVCTSQSAAFIVIAVSVQVWRQYTSLQKGLITAMVVIAVFFFGTLGQPANSLDTDMLASASDSRLASKDDLPYSNFDIILDHYSRISQFDATPTRRVMCATSSVHVHWS